MFLGPDILVSMDRAVQEKNSKQTPKSNGNIKQPPKVQSTNDGKETAKPPATIDEWLAAKTKKKIHFKSYQSFLKFHLPEKTNMFLFEVPKTSSGPLFCHQLTFEGLEGGVPELFMSVGASCGFRLDWDASGQVLLRQVQERLDDSVFGASMYSDDSGGMQNGVLFSFQVACCSLNVFQIWFQCCEWEWRLLSCNPLPPSLLPKLFLCNSCSFSVRFA